MNTQTIAITPASLASDWLALLKPRVLTLVVFTGAIGLVIAPVRMNPFIALVAILCITTAAGAAGAINMWYDRDIDAIMLRTSSRPIPSGRITPEGALAFGVILAVLSVLLMAVTTNLVAAVLLAASIAFYVFIYTMWLKRSTAQNIVIGGAAGAFPPMIGWAAATGDITTLPILLFAIIFFWTPPHFWALSLYAMKDYEKAGIPMLPNVRGQRHTRVCIMIYTLIMVPVTLLPFIMGELGLLYGASALILGGLFIYYSWKVLRDRQDQAGNSLTRNAPAKLCFRYSILYLFMLFGACAIDRLI